MKIAFFDSGVGGLTVLHEALKLMPHEDYIYFGDSDNAPYGTKSKEEIKILVNNAVNFLVGKNIKALVLACNTATSVMVQELRKRYDFPVIGMEPAVKLAVKNDSGKGVVVCATDLTLREEKLQKLVRNLDAEDIVEFLSLQGLVGFAERFSFTGQEVEDYIKSRFAETNWDNIAAVVLGCTHFLYFSDLLKKILPEGVQLIDGNLGTVKHLASQIQKKTVGPGSIHYYVSGKEASPEYFQKYLALL